MNTSMNIKCNVMNEWMDAVNEWMHEWWMQKLNEWTNKWMTAINEKPETWT